MSLRKDGPPKLVESGNPNSAFKYKRATSEQLAKLLPTQVEAYINDIKKNGKYVMTDNLSHVIFEHPDTKKKFTI